MKPEIEAKWLRIDKEMMRNILRTSGAELVHAERRMQRQVFSLAGRTATSKDGWLRVRDEGDKTTMTYKRLQDNSITGLLEIDIVVSDYGKACAMAEALGWRATSKQESLRESWRLADASIEIDTWPWLPPFLEIEAPTEEAVYEAAKLLGLRIGEARYGSVELIYQDVFDVADAEIGSWPEIAFSDVPGWLEAKRKQST